MKRIIAGLSVCLLLAVAPVLAQIDITPLEYGDVIFDEITPERPNVYYSFMAEAGDVVTISMVADDENELDPALFLYAIVDDEPTVIAANDNANPDTLHAQIANFIIPATDMYFIEAIAISGAGGYTLILMGDGESLLFDLPDGWSFEQVGVNNFYIGTDDTLIYMFFDDELDSMTAGEQFASIFEYVPAGGYVDVESMLDEFLSNFDLNPGEVTRSTLGRNEFARVPISEGAIEGFLYAVEVPGLDERGVIVLTMAGDTTAGQQIMDDIVASLVMSGASAGTGELQYGDSVRGTITSDQPSVFYTFEGEQGDVVTITMIADDESQLDTFLYLYMAEIMEIARNDDASDPSVGTLNSQIANFSLPETGTFTIEATRFSGAGDYTLTLELSDGGATNELGFQVTPPDRWLSDVDDTGIFLASSSNALDIVGGVDTLRAGDTGILFLWIPGENVAALDLTAPNVEGYLENFLAFLNGEGVVTSYDTSPYSFAAAIVAVEEPNPAFPDNTRLIVTEAPDGFFFWWVQYGEGDSYEDSEALVLDVIASLTFNGTPMYGND